MADTTERALAAQKKLSPAERAANFARATRRYDQVYPSLSKSAGETLRFSIDKVRLLSRIRLLIETTVTAVHASSTTYTPLPFAPYSLLKNIRVTSNMSFTPWISSGIGAYMLMLNRDKARTLLPVNGTAATPQTNDEKRAWAFQGKAAASSSGAVNTVRFVLDLPVAVNDRDPIGLILTQNQETKIDVEIDLGQAVDLATAATGFTFTLGGITVTPFVETFSVPVQPEAIPDLTIIKTVGEINETTTANRHAFKMPTGSTYRRLVWLLTDSSGVPVDDSALTGSFELVLNQSDYPQRIPGPILQRMHQEHTGTILPAGMWSFDLTYQGLINYGGSRDYMDTERLTEAWLIIQHPAALNLKVVYETLARMGG